jgi:hypothetical protein
MASIGLASKQELQSSVMSKRAYPRSNIPQTTQTTQNNNKSATPVRLESPPLQPKFATQNRDMEKMETAKK